MKKILLLIVLVTFVTGCESVKIGEALQEFCINNGFENVTEWQKSPLYAGDTYMIECDNKQIYWAKKKYSCTNDNCTESEVLFV